VPSVPKPDKGLLFGETDSALRLLGRGFGIAAFAFRLFCHTSKIYFGYAATSPITRKGKSEYLRAALVRRLLDLGGADPLTMAVCNTVS